MPDYEMTRRAPRLSEEKEVLQVKQAERIPKEKPTLHMFEIVDEDTVKYIESQTGSMVEQDALPKDLVEAIIRTGEARKVIDNSGNVTGQLILGEEIDENGA